MKMRSAYFLRMGVVLLLLTVFLGGGSWLGADDRDDHPVEHHDDRGDGGVAVGVDVTSLFDTIFNGFKKKKKEEGAPSPSGHAKVKEPVANDTDCPQRFEKLWADWLAFKQYIDALNMAIADRDAAYANVTVAYEALHAANLNALNAQMTAQRQPGNAAAAQAAATAQAAADKALADYNTAVTNANQAQSDVGTMYQAYQDALADYMAKVNDYDKHCIDYRPGPRPLPFSGNLSPPDSPGSSDSAGGSQASNPDNPSGTGKKPGASGAKPGGPPPPEPPHPPASTPDNPNPGGSTPGGNKPGASTPDKPNPTGSTPDKPNPAGSTPDKPNPSGSTPDKPNPNASTPDNPNPGGSTPDKPNPNASTPDNPYPGTTDGGKTGGWNPPDGGYHWPWQQPYPPLSHNDDDCAELYAKLEADMDAYRHICFQIEDLEDAADEDYDDAEKLVAELNELAQDYQALAQAGQANSAAAAQILLKMTVDQAALTEVESNIAYCHNQITLLYPQAVEMFTALVKEIAAYNKHCPTFKDPPPWPKDFGPVEPPPAPTPPEPGASKTPPPEEPQVPLVDDSFGTPSTQDRDDYCAALLAKAKAAQKVAYIAGQKFYAAIAALKAASALVAQLEQPVTDGRYDAEVAKSKYCQSYDSNHHGGTASADDVNNAWQNVKKTGNDLQKAEDAQAKSDAYAKAIADEKAKAAASKAAYAASHAAEQAFAPLQELYEKHCGPYPYDQFQEEFEQELGPQKPPDPADANEPPKVGDLGGPVQPHM